eukprot:868430-Pleurochrysis_carterae.AAC.4
MNHSRISYSNLAGSQGSAPVVATCARNDGTRHIEAIDVSGTSRLVPEQAASSWHMAKPVSST